MTVRDVAGAFGRQQQAAAAGTASVVAARWRQIDRDDIEGSWSEMIPGVTALVTVSQERAAETGAAYAVAAVREQDITPQPAGRVQPGRLAGVASDGRPLDTLLELPASQTVRALGRGVPIEEALGQSRRHLAMLAATQVLDAGRLATGIGITADTAVGGYRRQLRGATSCSRCVVLAGAWYRWNRGFQRHPACDCAHVPAVGPKSDLDGLEGFDPQAHFDALDPAEQDRVFTKAGAQAVRDGADLGQVVNARRGMRTTAAYGRRIRTTTEGTTGRMSSARRAASAAGDTASRGRIRLAPEQIYADAAGDRDEAIRLLGRFGYLA